MTASRRQGILWALGGVLFAAFFLGGGILGGMFATVPLPLPGSPATEVARYFEESGTAVLITGLFHMLSAAALLAFVSPVAALARRRGGAALAGTTSVGGVLAALFLFASAFLGWTLALFGGGFGPELVGALRQMNFLTGGTLHVASLGVFVGTASISVLGTKALPRWIVWLGIFQATLAILSLASLVFFPASLLILLGRMLGFVWCVGAGIALAFGKPRETAG